MSRSELPRWDGAGRWAGEWKPEVTDAQTRVLLALMTVHRRDGRATVGTVAEKAGLSSKSTAHVHLTRLKKKGLIEYGGGRHGTLRPLLAEALLERADYWAAEQ